MPKWLHSGKPRLLYASLKKSGKSLPAPPVLTSRHADPVTKTRSSSTNAPVCSGSGSPPGSASCKFPITESRCRGFGLPRLSYASRRPKPFRGAEGRLLERNDGHRLTYPVQQEECERRLVSKPAVGKAGFPPPNSEVSKWLNAPTSLKHQHKNGNLCYDRYISLKRERN